jgi:hypothetical protein
MERLLSTALLAVLCLSTLAVQAAELRGGADTGPGGNRARGELVLPLSGTAHSGWVQRYWADWANRDTDSGRSNGLGWGLGYRAAGKTGHAAAYVGPHYRRHQSSQTEHDGLDLQLQIEGSTRLGPNWQVSGDVSYLADSDLFWAEGSLLGRVNDRTYVGPFAAAEGSRDDYSRAAGVMTKRLFPRQDLEAGLKLGVEEYDGERGAFVGIQLEKRFR